MDTAAPGWNTLMDVVRYRAAETPERRAFTFLGNGRDESASLSYRQLDEAAAALGARLRSLGAAGERVLLLYPHGLDFVVALFGCWYAGAIAVPALPANRPGQALDRLKSIIADAAPFVTLVADSLAESLQELPALRASPMRVEITADLCSPMPDGSDAGSPSPSDPEAVCLLQYTSGSTDVPKGVMISHRNIMQNERMILGCFEHTRDSLVVSWLPTYHDMGLIGMLFQPLYVGNPCVLMSPVSFLQRPIRWLQAITKYRATTSGGPNFAYDMCVDRIREDDCEGLDLSTVEIAFSGAEPVRERTIRRFTERFAPYGFRQEAFYPCYGLAESTLLVTGGRKLSPLRIRNVDARVLESEHRAAAPAADSQIRHLVGCGTSPAGQAVRIVDPDSGLPLEDTRVGEIWVSGPCTASGYWEKPEVSEAVFGARLDDGDRTYLRTGDLGFLDEGELFVTGRLKELLIIRGQNHYPQDIEGTAERSHESLRPGSSAAFLLEEDDRERLVLVHELHRQHVDNPDVEGIAACVREAVSRDHGLHVAAVVLLKPGGVPKTSSGKIRRGDCRRLLVEGQLPILATDAHGGALDGFSEEGGG